MYLLCCTCTVNTRLSHMFNCLLYLEEDKTQIQEPHEGPVKFLTIKVLSSRETVTVAVDGTTVSGCC